MIDVVTASFENILENFFTGLILVDLRKVFDTVCHKQSIMEFEEWHMI